MKKIITTILLSMALMLSLSSCETVRYIYDNVEITWKPWEAKKEVAPVDSIVVQFDAVYWTEPPCMDGSIEEKEYEFTKDGYDVWMLYNPYARRIEVTKRDTVIYIYRK